MTWQNINKQWGQNIVSSFEFMSVPKSQLKTHLSFSYDCGFDPAFDNLDL